MRLLLLVPGQAHSGNGTTARRIQDHLEAAGHMCIVKDTSGYESSLAVLNLISSEPFEAALGVHLYKAGRLLQGSGIPFGIVFGGTDVNEDAKSDAKACLMGKVLAEARFALSFTEAMKETAAAYWPEARNKIFVQAQGIVTFPNAQLDWRDFLQSAGISQDDPTLRVFLLICGLRRVKDPLFLLDAFSEWHQEDSRVHLIIVGPPADPAFAEMVKEKVNRTRGVHLSPAVRQEDLHAAVKKCFAVVNSSISEGMSAAILEAMDLNVPVLARNIPGNAAIVMHRTTGLLYSTPQEFVQLAKSLMSDPFLRSDIVRKARDYITKHHTWEKERKVYQKLVLSLG